MPWKKISVSGSQGSGTCRGTELIGQDSADLAPSEPASNPISDCPIAQSADVLEVNCSGSVRNRSPRELGEAFQGQQFTQGS